MSGTSEGEWSEEFDLIVLGAGGAGMTAALVGAMPASNSERKYLIALPNGSTAPGA